MQQGEAIVLEYRALKCLRQGEANPEMMAVAEKFATLAARRLFHDGFFTESANITRKLIDK